MILRAVKILYENKRKNSISFIYLFYCIHKTKQYKNELQDIDIIMKICHLIAHDFYVISDYFFCNMFVFGIKYILLGNVVFWQYILLHIYIRRIPF